MLLVSLALCTSSFLCFALAEPTYRVISVIDGNTIQIMTTDGERVQILLYGVDSPDEGQKFFMEAKLLLEGSLLNKMVTLIDRGKDRYGNRIAEVTAKEVHDPQRELLRSGLEWTSQSDPELEALKEQARKQGLGIWADENPMPPWLYRRQQSMLKPKTN